MSGLNFRARQLEHSKPLPILLAEDIPGIDMNTYVQRALPRMATGMEKEEEEEHHLKIILRQDGGLASTTSVIPTPTAGEKVDYYDEIYQKDFMLPGPYIRIKDLPQSVEFVDYDADSEDDAWLARRDYRHSLLACVFYANVSYWFYIRIHGDRISCHSFETMIDRLECAAPGQKALPSFHQVRDLLKMDDSAAMEVYEYWKSKRARNQGLPLRPVVKTDKSNDPASVSNPYVAFRRRADKILTRKHRKVEEHSYERMVKLKRDFEKLRTLLEMVKKREKLKRERIHLALEIFEARLSANDWTFREFIKEKDEPKKKSEYDEEQASKKINKFFSSHRSRSLKKNSEKYKKKPSQPRSGPSEALKEAEDRGPVEKQEKEGAEPGASPKANDGLASTTVTTIGGAQLDLARVYSKGVTQGYNPFPFSSKKKHIGYWPRLG
ncbi:enhancer of polycomb homolog 1-like [Zophobas morio]|uniref:enhancer of polycomb homolog 1-like n=1 Tax=Zophobas morio TaxID=2755281 RepID=UPI003083B218